MLDNMPLNSFERNNVFILNSVPKLYVGLQAWVQVTVEARRWHWIL